MKNTFVRRSLLILGLLPLASTTSAAPHTPRVGSPERTAILNALRPSLGGGKHKPIITPRHFRVERGWAYITGGFNYQNAPLEPQFLEGSGTNFSALLQKQGQKWKIKRQIYNGDVIEPEFIRAFPSAPRAIFR